MRKVRHLPRLLSVPLALALTGQGRLSAADVPVLRGQESWIETSDEVVSAVDYGPVAQRNWYFRSEGLALKRYTPDKQQFAGYWVPPNNAVDPPVAGFHVFALDTEDLEFEFQGGYRVALGRRLGDRFSVEFNYFDIGDWFETAAVRNTEPNDQGGLGILMSPFTNFGNPAGVVGVDYLNFVNIESSSTLDNMELNLWTEHPMPPDSMGVSTMVGLRYMSVMEQFRYHSETTSGVVATNTVDTRTRNKLLGVQLGALLEFPVDPGWWIDWELKGAILHNRAGQDTEYLNVNQGNPLTFSTSRKENRTTFVGETSVRIVYEVSHRLVAYAGYQAMWTDGLALASENVPTDLSILMVGPGQLDHNGNIVYHGPHMGLTLMW